MTTGAGPGLTQCFHFSQGLCGNTLYYKLFYWLLSIRYVKLSKYSSFLKFIWLYYDLTTVILKICLDSKIPWISIFNNPHTKTCIWNTAVQIISRNSYGVDLLEGPQKCHPWGVLTNKLLSVLAPFKIRQTVPRWCVTSLPSPVVTCLLPHLSLQYDPLIICKESRLWLSVRNPYDCVFPVQAKYLPRHNFRRII